METVDGVRTNWHSWFCWYPVYSIEYGWVWLRKVNRKKIPKDYVERAKRSASAKLSEYLTGCWHRIPEAW